ncbi:MAG: pilus assembly FimT family protein [Syntrophales bacterium]
MPFPMHRRDTGGFTLLELIVVLTIIGLMSVLVAPKLVGPLADLDLKTASQKISASLRYARSRAAAEKVTMVALFDFGANRLVIDPPAPPPGAAESNQGGREAGPAPEEANDRPTGRRTYRLPDNVKLVNGVSREGGVQTDQFRVVFFPSGGSSGGEITVANERGRRYSIRVDFITGTVQLAEARGSG